MAHHNCQASSPSDIYLRLMISKAQGSEGLLEKWPKANSRSQVQKSKLNQSCLSWKQLVLHHYNNTHTAIDSTRRQDKERWENRTLCHSLPAVVTRQLNSVYTGILLKLYIQVCQVDYTTVECVVHKGIGWAFYKKSSLQNTES